INGLNIGLDQGANRTDTEYIDDVSVDTVSTGTASSLNVDDSLHVGGTSNFGSNVNIQSAGTGSSPLTINDATTGINLLQVKDLNQNFGSAVTAGAFLQRTSYFGEEFNKFLSTNTDSTTSTTTNTNSRRGDNTELSTSSLIGATAGSCAYSSNSNALGGTERIAAASSTGTQADCSELLSTATAGTSQKLWAANNLPIVQMKVQPSAAPTGNSNTRFFYGLSDNNTSAAGVPTNGIFFTNCTTTTPTCTSAQWVGMVIVGGTVAGTVTCTAGAETGTINTTGFNYLRIEVRSNTDIHFFVDTTTTDGIVETECGSGVQATGPGATALGLYMAGGVNATGLTLNTDIDYVRVWQDDAPVDNSSDNSAASNNSTADTTDLSSAPPISPDSPDPSIAGSFFNFLGATSEDTVINGNLFVHGTIYADKIEANQIEGLQIYTDELGSLQQQLNAVKADTTTANGSGGSEDSSSSESSSGSDGALSLDISASGLTVGGDATFQGNVFFYKLVTFVQKTVFNDDVTFGGHITTAGTTPTVNLETAAGITVAPPIDPNNLNAPAPNLAKDTISGNDNSGQLSITFGDNASAGELLTVNFNKPFDNAPNIFLSPTNQAAAGLKYYITSTTTGFKITVTDPLTAGTTMNFSYWVVQ
ncbi:MAG TPA: hypothetical protein VEH48_01290, partial [Candidatus Nitrosopolaris sp.]|nr:hypothetical protein [Candidatus Nitrosopolaris sp.]